MACVVVDQQGYFQEALSGCEYFMLTPQELQQFQALTAGDTSSLLDVLQDLSNIDPSTVALIVGFYVAMFIIGAGAKLTTNLMKRA